MYLTWSTLLWKGVGEKLCQGFSSVFSQNLCHTPSFIIFCTSAANGWLEKVSWFPEPILWKVQARRDGIWQRNLAAAPCSLHRKITASRTKIVVTVAVWTGIIQVSRVFFFLPSTSLWGIYSCNMHPSITVYTFTHSFTLLCKLLFCTLLITMHVTIHH